MSQAVTQPEPDCVDDARADQDPAAGETAVAELVEEDLLVEDVSIDGMCGVY